MLREEINLGHANYEVICSNGVLGQLGDYLKKLGLGKKCALVTDTNILPCYGDRTIEHLVSGGYDCSVHVFSAGEDAKALNQVEVIAREMVQSGHDRHSFVIALGGGVTGDLAGFVAATFFRGIPFIQIPTTIVAQVDSSIGGKTGVNIPEGKNLIGAFHQPKLVLIDPDTLSTLPPRAYREGFAEVIKHALISDASMLGELESFSPQNQSPPESLIMRNVAIKADIVRRDEKETSGARALLNFGHTIGHAIEASVPYGQLLHGEAISLGMRAALYLSEQHSSLTKEEVQRALTILKHFQLPLVLDESIKIETILERLKTDKKFKAGQISFVLLKRLGDAFLSDSITEEDIIQAVQAIREPVMI